MVRGFDSHTALFPWFNSHTTGFQPCRFQPFLGKKIEFSKKVSKMVGKQKKCPGTPTEHPRRQVQLTLV